MKKAEFTLAQVAGFILILLVIGFVGFFLYRAFNTTVKTVDDCTVMGFTCTNDASFCERTSGDGKCKGEFEGMTCCVRLKSEDYYSLGTGFLDDTTNNKETLTFRNGATHTITVTKIKVLEADLEVASDPLKITVKYGEDKNISLEMPYRIQVIPSIETKTVGQEKIPVKVRVLLTQDIKATLFKPGTTGETVLQMYYKYDIPGAQPNEIVAGSTYQVTPGNKLLMTTTFENAPKYCVSYLEYWDEQKNNYFRVPTAIKTGNSANACKELKVEYTPIMGDTTKLRWVSAGLLEKDSCNPSATNDLIYLPSCWLPGAGSASAVLQIEQPRLCSNNELTPRIGECLCGTTMFSITDPRICFNQVVVDCSLGTSCFDYCKFMPGNQDSCEFPNTEEEFCWEDVCNYNTPTGCKIEQVNDIKACKPSSASVHLDPAVLLNCKPNTPITQDCTCGIGAEILLASENKICIKHTTYVPSPTVKDCTQVLVGGCEGYCTFDSTSAECEGIEQVACASNYCNYPIACDLVGTACQERVFT